ncbi:MAG: C40 family peptidase [Bacteroidetes bacterium]|nr:C40 family peptidase [Bacteroidota bacterium]MBS1628517.1 C40 family peptidase [Bacteroidota bacterium]
MNSVISSPTDTEFGTNLRAKYAALLNVLPQAICNLALYRFIDEWYGVRYQLGGSSKEGIDCSAFIQKLYEQVFGISLLRTALMQVEETSRIKDATKCQEGDLIFFKSRKGRISHVGLYLKNDFFVHASSSQGIMISSLDDAYWGKRFACAGRVL